MAGIAQNVLLLAMLAAFGIYRDVVMQRVSDPFAAFGSIGQQRGRKRVSSAPVQLYENCSYYGMSTVLDLVVAWQRHSPSASPPGQTPPIRWASIQSQHSDDASGSSVKHFLHMISSFYAVLAFECMYCTVYGTVVPVHVQLLRSRSN